MNDDRAVYVRQLIAARAPELSVDEVIEAFTPDDDADRLPLAITEDVLNVIAALAARLDAMEGRLTPGRLN